MVLVLLNGFKPLVRAFHFQIIFPCVLGVHNCFCVRAAAGFNTQRVHISICLDKVDFLPPVDKIGYQDKMRNTVNIKLANLVRGPNTHTLLIFASFTICNHTSQGPLLLCSKCSCVQPHCSDTVWPKSMLSPFNNVALLHIHHDGFSAWVPTHPLTSHCSFLSLLSSSTSS